MKKRLTFLLLLCVWAAGAFAQLPTNAQGYEKSFWQYIEKLKVTDPVAAKGAYQNSVTQAQTNLNQLKKYAPTYDVSKHEAALRPYTEADAKAAAEKTLATDRAMVEERLANISEARGIMRTDAISSAEKGIARLKANTPTFDASAYEKQLADYKASEPVKTVASSPSGGAAPSGSGAGKSEFESQYWTTFKGRTACVTFKTEATFSDEEIAAAESKCTSTRDKYNAFANSPVAQFGKTLSVDAPTSMLKTALEDEAFVGKTLEKIKNAYESAIGRGSAVRNHFELLQLCDYWTAQAKIFPQSSVIQETVQKINALRTELGGVQKMIDKAASNYDIQVQKATVPAAARRDAGLEAEFKAILLNTGRAKEVIKVNLAQMDWQINRNTATGIILNRSQVANIIVPGENDRCIVHIVSITQDYNGSSYGKSHLTFSEPTYYSMLCKNVQ